MAKTRRAHEHEEHADETWLIPYSDLLTLLLALFIVLFASSSIDARKFQAIMVSFNSVLSGGSNVFDNSSKVPLNTTITNVIRHKSKTQDTHNNQSSNQAMNQQFAKETQDLQKLKKQIDQYIHQNGLTTQLSTELNQKQLLLKISDNALFASGKAAVKPEAKKLAVAISDLLAQYPSYQVVVAGYTDNRPISTPEFRDNWDLSSMRALNFMRILLDNQKLKPSRFSAVGYGEYHPVASNDSAAGRAKNRRVEVAIKRNITAATPDNSQIQANSGS